MGVGARLKVILTSFVRATGVPINLGTDNVGNLFVTTAAGAPVQVEGTEAEGAAGTANPIQIAGRTPAPGNLVLIPDVIAGATHNVFLVDIADGAGNLMPTMDAQARRGYIQLADGTTLLEFPIDNSAVKTHGIHHLGEYAAVPAARGDGDAARIQTDAYGHQENAPYSRAIGADQTSEIAPPIYDVQSGTARASAALPAAGAYDAAATEIPCAGLKYCILAANYTRGAALGSCGIRLQKCITIGGTDYWYDEIIQNPAAFAAGADSQINIQRSRPYVYQATGAALEAFGITIDNLRCDKIRFPSAEVGAIANPGTLALFYKLSN